DDRDFVGIVDPARSGGLERRQREGEHEHRANGREAGAVRKDLDDQPLDAPQAKTVKEILDALVGASDRTPELEHEAVEPGVGVEHAGFLAPLFLVIERVLQGTLQTTGPGTLLGYPGKSRQ